MNEEQLKKLLEELMIKTRDGPGSYTDVLSQIARRHTALKELQEIIAEINESMSTFRLIITYLIFDLEATRRERDTLRTMLEDQDND